MIDYVCPSGEIGGGGASPSNVLKFRQPEPITDHQAGLAERETMDSHNASGGCTRSPSATKLCHYPHVTGLKIPM